MTKITIISKDEGSSSAVYRASYGGRESLGDSVGSALDALNEQLPPNDASTIVLIQRHKPDSFFDATKQRRLQELLALQRSTEAAGKLLSPESQAELERLVNEELAGSADRAASLADEMGL